MKLLITGGAGTLGSNIIEKLYKDSSVEILCIDNFETGSKKNISFFPEEKIIEGSITNEKLLREIFKNFKPEIIIHSAASYKDPDNYQNDAHTNIIGAINIGRLSSEFNVSKIINFQTALCYGIPKKSPIPINHTLEPFTSYGISKTHAEYYLSKIGVPLVSLRLANICSKNLSIGPIPTFYKRLKEGKSCFCSDAKRDFLDFDDFFDLLKVILFKSNITGFFNVSTGIGNTITDVFEEVKNNLNLKNISAEVRPINSDDIAEVILDPSETTKLFDWKPKIGFKEMIEKQINFFKTDGIDSIFSHLKNRNE